MASSTSPQSFEASQGINTKVGHGNESDSVDGSGDEIESDSSLSSGSSTDDSDEDGNAAAGHGRRGPEYSLHEAHAVLCLREKYPAGRLPSGARVKITRALNKWRKSEAEALGEVGAVVKRNSNSWRVKYGEMMAANMSMQRRNEVMGTNHAMPYITPSQLPVTPRGQRRH